MGRSFALTALLFAFLFFDRAVLAQEPLPPASFVSTSLQAPPCVCPPPPATVAIPTSQPGVASDREPLFAIEAILGQETGVRGQFALPLGNHEALVAEGFFGELYHDLGSSLALGAGARYLIQSGWFDCIDALQLGPGVDVFFQLNHNGLILLTPSIDLAWLHKLGAGVEFELGLDAGLGVGVAGHTRHGNSGAGYVTTLISIYTGLRF